MHQGGNIHQKSHPWPSSATRRVSEELKLSPGEPDVRKPGKLRWGLIFPLVDQTPNSNSMLINFMVDCVHDLFGYFKYYLLERCS